ncbi:hypothetical protein JCM30204_54100 [Dysgonomonas termitidis]
MDVAHYHGFGHDQFIIAPVRNILHSAGAHGLRGFEEMATVNNDHRRRIGIRSQELIPPDVMAKAFDRDKKHRKEKVFPKTEKLFFKRLYVGMRKKDK